MTFPEDEIEEGEEHQFQFDLGIVLEVLPDPDFPGEYRCVMLCGHGSRLYYGAYNLWVPQFP